VTYISDFLYSRALDYGSVFNDVVLNRYECGNASNLARIIAI